MMMKARVFRAHRCGVLWVPGRVFVYYVLSFFLFFFFFFLGCFTNSALRIKLAKMGSWIMNGLCCFFSLCLPSLFLFGL